jgi:hypothetical protein
MLTHGDIGRNALLFIKKAFLEEYFASESQINVQIEICGPLAYSSFGNYD